MPQNTTRSYFIHALLFILTCITTTLAGAEWQYGRGFIFTPEPLGWPEFWQGLYFSVPFLGVLTVHEFGHYITAQLYKVRVTLPYYIPLWLGIGSFGTMGAFIRIKSTLSTRQEYFDIGVAGPLAGFVVAMGVIWYGFTHLPPPEHIFTIHPEYQQYGLNYADFVYKNTQGSLSLGTNLIFLFFERFVVEDPSRIPNMYEMAHYPFLLAGYLSLLFTALNLIPIGQLDGGHILFSLIGYKAFNKVAPVIFIGFVFYAGLGLITPFDSLDALMVSIPLYLGFLFLAFSRTTPQFKNTLLLSVAVFATQFLLAALIPGIKGYSGWLVFALILGRFLGVYHPPVLYEKPLSVPRKIIGWIALLIFILSFSPEPFVIL